MMGLGRFETVEQRSCYSVWWLLGLVVTRRSRSTSQST